MSESNILKFTLRRKSIQVDLDGQVHTLKELSGRGREAYMNRLKDNVEINMETGKPTKINNLNGVLCFLVSQSIYDATGAQVPLEVVEEWPADVVQALADESVKLSGLGKEAATAAGNGSGASG